MNRLKPESFLAKTYQNHLAFSLKNNYNEVVNKERKANGGASYGCVFFLIRRTNVRIIFGRTYTMKNLGTNEWTILNNIIYKIYTTEHFDEMRLVLLEELRMLIDFDSADFYVAAEHDEKKLAHPVKLDMECDFAQEYEQLDVSRGILFSGKSLIYRETDLVSDEARMATDYYQHVFKPNNWHYSLQMVIAKDHHFLGVITFYRSIGKENFHYDDIFILDMLKNHLAFQLEKHHIFGEDEQEKLTVSQTVEKYNLTRRESTILRMLMSGRENAVICEELVISANTLKKHILNIYRKLGIRNRVQLFKMIKERE